MKAVRQKAISYRRFSSRKQMRGDSLRRQTEAARRYAEAHNLDLDENLTSKYLSCANERRRAGCGNSVNVRYDEVEEAILGNIKKTVFIRLFPDLATRKMKRKKELESQLLTCLHELEATRSDLNGVETLLIRRPESVRLLQRFDTLEFREKRLVEKHEVLVKAVAEVESSNGDFEDDLSKTKEAIERMSQVMFTGSDHERYSLRLKLNQLIKRNIGSFQLVPTGREPVKIWVGGPEVKQIEDGKGFDDESDTIIEDLDKLWVTEYECSGVVLLKWAAGGGSFISKKQQIVVMRKAPRKWSLRNKTFRERYENRFQEREQDGRFIFGRA